MLVSPGSSRRCRRLVTALLSGVLGVLLPGAAFASVQVVTTTADSGAGSLRAALQTASSGDVIAIDSSLAGQTITLSTVGDTTHGPSALTISKQLIIAGPSGGVTIARASAAAPMRLLYVSSTGSLTLTSVTLSGGLAKGGAGADSSNGAGAGGGGAGFGGAIFNEGSLVVSQVLFTNNSALGGKGGNGSDGSCYCGDAGGGGGGEGVDASGSTGGGTGASSASRTGAATAAGFGGGGAGGPWAPQSSVGNGTAGGFGGGGGGFGGYYINANAPGGFGGGSSGTGNSGSYDGSAGGGGAGMGGALFNNGGQVTVVNCVFTGNLVQGGPAGTGPADVGTATAGQGLGGAILSRNGSLTLSFSTLTANTADAGGDVYVVGDGAVAQAELESNIINYSTGGGTDLDKANTNGGSAALAGAHNLVRYPADSVYAVTGLVMSLKDPMLGSLQNNGGPIQTFAIGLDGVAMNGVDCASANAPDVDARGKPRPYGSQCDIGAFELAYTNTAPNIVTIGKTTAENTPVTFSATDFTTIYSDAERDPLVSVQFPSLPSNGSLSLNGQPVTTSTVIARADLGNLVYLPNPGFNGQDTCTWTASDWSLASAPANLILTVTQVNQPPVAVDVTLSMSYSEGMAAITIPVAAILASDSPGPANEASQTITVTGVSSPMNGMVALDATGQNVIFTPVSPTFYGQASFQYTITDNGTTNGQPDGKSASGNVFLNILAVNDPPAAMDVMLPPHGENEAQFTIPYAALLANAVPGMADEAGQTLTVTAVANTTGGTATLDPSGVIFTLDQNFTGLASFQFTVTDNGTSNGQPDPKSATATASFTVWEVNQAPVVPDVMLEASPDDQPLMVPAASLLQNATPGPQNELNQTLTITGVGQPVGGTVSFDGSLVTFTPTPGFTGTASFQFTVTDNGTTNGQPAPLSVTATASFTLYEVNQPPTAMNVTLPASQENQPVTVPLSTLLAMASPGPSYESSQTLTVSAVTQAMGGTAAIQDSNVVFTPTSGFNGMASFQFTVTDNGTTNGQPDPKSATATASFTIYLPNQAPVVPDVMLPTVSHASGAAPVVQLPFSQLLAGAKPGMDPSEASQHLTITAVSGATGGTVTINNGLVAFTVDGSFSGTASFQFTVTDDGTTNGQADPKSTQAKASFQVTLSSSGSTGSTGGSTPPSKSGGCSTGGGASWALMLGLMAAMILRRRSARLQ